MKFLLSVLIGVLCAFGGIDLERGSTGRGVGFIVAGMGLFILYNRITFGSGHRSSIRPGEYVVHMLKPLGNRVIVVVTLYGTEPSSQFFRTYALPLEWFSQNVNPYIGGHGVFMNVVREGARTRIQLREAFPQMRKRPWEGNCYDRRNIPEAASH